MYNICMLYMYSEPNSLLKPCAKPAVGGCPHLKRESYAPLSCAPCCGGGAGSRPEL